MRIRMREGEGRGRFGQESGSQTPDALASELRWGGGVGDGVGGRGGRWGGDGGLIPVTGQMRARAHLESDIELVVPAVTALRLALR